MTDEQSPQLPPPGPSGYQPEPGEGVEDFTVIAESDGTVKVDVSYVFPAARPTVLAMQAIDELVAVVAAMLVPKVGVGDIPRVAAPKAPAPDPAADVRPPTAGARLVDAPTMFPTPTPAAAAADVGNVMLAALRAGAISGFQQPAGSPAEAPVDRAADIQQINDRNMGPNGPF